MDLLKMDKNLFFSIINMKLRDEFKDLHDLCSYYSISIEDMEKKLSEYDYVYIKDINQIKNK